MSKTLKIIAILLILIVAGGVMAWHYLPVMLAKAIVNEDGGLIPVIQVIPTPVKKSINHRIDVIPQKLKELEAQGVYITIDDIIKAIDEAKSDEIIRTIDALESAKPETTDQVIGIVLDNMDFGKLENEKIISIAKQNMKISDVKKAMKMIRENGRPYALTIPMGKETVKGLLLEKKKEIEAKLNP